MIVRLLRKYKVLQSDIQFAEILKGSLFTFFSRVAGTGLGFLISILIARYYGAEMLGIMAIVQAFIMMSSVLALLGTNISILKLIPEHLAKYSFTSAYNVYRKIQLLVASTALILGLLVWSLGNEISDKIGSTNQYSTYITTAALFLIFKVMMDLTCETIRGVRLIRLYAFMQSLPQIIFFTLLLVCIITSGQKNDPFWAQLATWSIVSIIGIVILERFFLKRKNSIDKIKRVSFKELFSLSLPMLMTAAMHLLVAQVGIIILSIYSSPHDVGHYSAAVKLATLTLFVLQAVNSMAAPKFSELYHTDSMDELFRVAQKSAKLIFWATSPILLLLIMFGDLLLSMFGDDFSSAYLPMMILVAGQFVNSISGSTGYFMNMTGSQNTFRNIILVSTIINILLCIILIPRYDLMGASVASFSSLAFWNICALVYIKKKYGQMIGYVPFLKL